MDWKKVPESSIGKVPPAPDNWSTRKIITIAFPALQNVETVV